jgi:hypothetical protein
LALSSFSAGACAQALVESRGLPARNRRNSRRAVRDVIAGHCITVRVIRGWPFGALNQEAALAENQRNALLVVERWILAALRHHRFFTLAELNHAIGQLLEKLNLRPFRKREGTRTSLFVAVDQPALQPLPAATTRRLWSRFSREDSRERSFPAPMGQNNYFVPLHKIKRSNKRFTRAFLKTSRRGLDALPWSPAAAPDQHR